MDLGISGRRAIVCASSRGLGRACAQALAAAGCEVVINGRDEESVKATAAALQRDTGAKVDSGAGRRGDPGGPGGAVRGLPRAGHPGQQQCRAAAARLSRADPPTDHRRRGRQHGGGDRADPEVDRSHDAAALRPHRQHHLGRREAAAGRPRSLLGRPRRIEHLRGRRRPPGRRGECDHQQSAAGRVRHRPAAIDAWRRQPSARTSAWSRPRPSGSPACRPSASAIRPSSAPLALSSAPPRPATSPGRIS